MVASRESLTTLTLSRRPSPHMGRDSQIPTAGRGSIKIQHDDFKNVLYVPSPTTKQIVEYEEEA